jgi:hypothetical protein
MNNEKTAYLPIDHLDPNITTYYTKTVHTYGYTDLILLDEEGNPVQRTFEPKTFTGFIATN